MDISLVTQTVAYLQLTDIQAQSPDFVNLPEIITDYSGKFLTSS